MPVTVALLRGINVGGRNKVPMADLRGALADAGLPNARTYVQSGNVIVESDRTAAQVAETIHDVVRGSFGPDVPVLTRTREELAAVVAADPLGDVADNHKLYSVTFLSGEPDPAGVGRARELVAGGERLEVIGRELYSWHPDGMARSKLALAVVDKRLRADATARNWRTVTTLLEMCDG